MANVTVFVMFIITIFALFGLHLFNGMYEYRCRLTEEPYKNGSWPLLPDYYKLCNMDWDNCPENSFCTKPASYNDWDRNEINVYDFNYGVTGFDP